MKTKRTNWSTHPTFGGSPLVSRATGKAFAATDHCVALVKTCPRCFEKYMATPTKQDHDCAPAEVAADRDTGIAIRYVKQYDIQPDQHPTRFGD